MRARVIPEETRTTIGWLFGREAASAAEHMGVGVTALGKADYSRDAYYSQAFFALTIGFERAAKLAIVVDHVRQHNGQRPTTNEIKSYGHDLRRLLDRADQIALSLGSPTPEDRLPCTNIHDAIIDVLHNFANNTTRYYNLELMTGSLPTVGRDDPVRQWFERVVKAVLDLHYEPHRQDRDKQKAQWFHQLISNYTSIRHHNETGEPISTVYQASLHKAITAFATPYVRMYVLQIVRFFALLLSQLAYAAQTQGVQDVPDLSEVFRVFTFGTDSYLKRRKSWSIYQR